MLGGDRCINAFEIIWWDNAQLGVPLLLPARRMNKNANKFRRSSNILRATRVYFRLG